MTAFTSLAIEVGSAVVLFLAAGTTGYLAKLIRKRIRGEALRGILLRVNDSVYTRVREAEQVAVKQAKEASEGGRLTAEEAARIKEEVLSRLLEDLGTVAATEAKALLGLCERGLNSYLGAKVEAAVHDVRLGHGLPDTSIRLPIPALGTVGS
jgi:hypothetical protein